jgi:sigma54-dependent transcription regulator
MYVGGISMHAIAKALRIAVGTVHADISKARQEWTDENNERLELLKDKQLTLIDEIEARATAAYEQSGRDYSQTTSEAGPRGKRLRVTKREQVGEAAFLKTLLTCIELRCRILGLFAPKAVELDRIGSSMKILVGIDLEML